MVVALSYAYRAIGASLYCMALQARSAFKEPCDRAIGPVAPAIFGAAGDAHGGRASSAKGC